MQRSQPRAGPQEWVAYFPHGTLVPTRSGVSDQEAALHTRLAMEMRISFPGGATAVNAEFGGHLVETNQPRRAGGTGTAPAPFDLFLASIATCAGFYALSFCQKRDIDTGDLGVRLETIRDPNRKRVGHIVITVELPREFPKKYRAAIIRAIDQCAGKRHILEPPDFTVNVSLPAAVAAEATTDSAGGGPRGLAQDGPHNYALGAG